MTGRTHSCSLSLPLDTRAGQTRLDPTRHPPTRHNFPFHCTLGLYSVHLVCTEVCTEHCCTHHYHCHASQSHKHSAYHKNLDHNLLAEYSYRNIFISKSCSLFLVPGHQGWGCGQSVSSGGVKVEVTHCIGWGCRCRVEVEVVHAAHNIFLYQILFDNSSHTADAHAD